MHQHDIEITATERWYLRVYCHTCQKQLLLGGTLNYQRLSELVDAHQGA